MVEHARLPIHRGAMKTLRKVQNTGQRVFSHRQVIAQPSRGRHHHAAAPEIAHEQIAGAGRALMKPFQPWCPGAQIERKWPATKDDFSFSEQAIAFLAGPRAGGAWCQVACRGEGRPRFANFPVIPAPGVRQFDRRIDRLNLRSIFGADTLNTQDVDPLHGHLPKPLTWKGRSIMDRRQCGNCRPLAAAGLRWPDNTSAAGSSRAAVGCVTMPPTGATPSARRRGTFGADKLWALAFVTPYVAIFVAFVIYPVGYGLWLGSDPASYRALFGDPVYPRTVVNTLLYLLFGVNPVSYTHLR